MALIELVVQITGTVIVSSSRFIHALLWSFLPDVWGKPKIRRRADPPESGKLSSASSSKTMASRRPLSDSRARSRLPSRSGVPMPPPKPSSQATSNNCKPASSARSLAYSVLPVPGGP